ncbi:hypothetical protein A0O34_08345 [Chryseobacterium glaciei]|uniref:Immunity protein 35 domain-containing protein n=1 Tax=Chryseobacterium glaciei TaxID=1685010 RepID=A0A172XU31_9FLAO|nr:hypothetical protein [Chryseobacterium glaciei]ANF50529.1 hypothetical protein A0O34_08345 [Chryseobacterium glaciei]
MYTEEQAKAKMQRFVDYQNNLIVWNEEGEPNIIIYEELTERHPFGWVFYWQIKDDYSNFLAGNGPIIIEKDTLNMFKMMTAISTEENITLYKKDKNKLLQLEEDQDGFFDPVNI